MIFDWGQISEVIFFALSLMCPSFSLVSLCDDAGFTFEIISMSMRLPRNQKSSSSATPTPQAWGWFVHDTSKQPDYGNTWDISLFLLQCKSNIVKIWLVNSRRACQVGFNTVKCPFLFIPTFQLKCWRRSHGQMITFTNTFYYEFNPVWDEYCELLSDWQLRHLQSLSWFPCISSDVVRLHFMFKFCSFWRFSCPSPGPPVGVGMNIDIASIDMVSEVNMVSGSLSPLFLQ